jgi:hypothetical protein
VRAARPLSGWRCEARGCACAPASRRTAFSSTIINLGQQDMLDEAVVVEGFHSLLKVHAFYAQVLPHG